MYFVVVSSHSPWYPNGSLSWFRIVAKYMEPVMILCSHNYLHSDKHGYIHFQLPKDIVVIPIFRISDTKDRIRSFVDKVSLKVFINYIAEANDPIIMLNNVCYLPYKLLKLMRCYKTAIIVHESYRGMCRRLSYTLGFSDLILIFSEEYIGNVVDTKFKEKTHIVGHPIPKPNIEYAHYKILRNIGLDSEEYIMLALRNKDFEDNGFIDKCLRLVLLLILNLRKKILIAGLSPYNYHILISKLKRRYGGMKDKIFYLKQGLEPDLIAGIESLSYALILYRKNNSKDVIEIPTQLFEFYGTKPIVANITGYIKSTKLVANAVTAVFKNERELINLLSSDKAYSELLYTHLRTYNKLKIMYMEDIWFNKLLHLMNRAVNTY